MLSNQEVSEANELIKDITSLYSKPSTAAMYVISTLVEKLNFVSAHLASPFFFFFFGLSLLFC